MKKTKPQKLEFNFSEAVKIKHLIELELEASEYRETTRGKSFAKQKNFGEAHACTLRQEGAKYLALELVASLRTMVNSPMSILQLQELKLK